MSNSMNKNKPANPAPPLNALKNPEVKKPAEKPVEHRSVYDEIAERRKREKHKIGVSASREKEEIVPGLTDDISDIIEELKKNRDDDVKVYTPEKKSAKSDAVGKSVPDAADDKPYRDIYVSETEPEPESETDEENFDVPAMPKPKPDRHVGFWAAVIASLGALCLIAAGVYCAVNGYFDGIISLF